MEHESKKKHCEKIQTWAWNILSSEKLITEINYAITRIGILLFSLDCILRACSDSEMIRSNLLYFVDNSVIERVVFRVWMLAYSRARSADPIYLAIHLGQLKIYMNLDLKVEAYSSLRSWYDSDWQNVQSNLWEWVSVSYAIKIQTMTKPLK